MIAMRYGQAGKRTESIGETSVSLWTNPSPNSSYSGNITVSNAMTGFKRICIAYKMTTSSSVIHQYFDTADFTFDGGYSNEVGLISRPGSNGYMRRLVLASSTTINVSTAYRLNASGSSTSYSIPVEIMGIN